MNEMNESMNGLQTIESVTMATAIWINKKTAACYIEYRKTNE